jgi:hypothetical protein
MDGAQVGHMMMGLGFRAPQKDHILHSTTTSNSSDKLQSRKATEGLGFRV